MDPQLDGHRAELIRLTRMDRDAKVCHRAHVLLAALDAPSNTAAARATGVSVRSLQRWRTRYLAEGAVGLRDQPRPGRPPKPNLAAQALLAQAVEASPMEYGYAVSTWTAADLGDLLRRRGWPVATATVYRLLHRLGYQHRRPRHDLHHRQDAEAVASARHVLATLQKRGLISGAASACSTSTNANCTPIPTWQRSGSAPGLPAASPPPEPIGG